MVGSHRRGFMRRANSWVFIVTRQAFSGLRAWLVQRVSAVYMAGFTLFFAIAVTTGVAENFEAWHSWVTGTVASIAIGVFVIALLAHTWVGIRDVVMDYVHPFAWRLGVLMGLSLVLLAMGVWVLRVLVLHQGGVLVQ